MRVRIVAPRLRWLATPLQRFVLGSVLVHLLVTAGLLWLPALGRSKDPFEEAFFVDLRVAAPAVKAATPAAPDPAPPQPTVAPPAPAPPEPTVIPRPSQKKTTAEPAPGEPPRIDRDTSPAPNESAHDAQEPSDAVTATAGDSEASVSAGMDLAGAALDWYRSAVTASLYSSWRRPVLAAGGDESLEVRVGFEILRNGRVQALRVVAASGVDSLDRSALRSVADATLPPLPASWTESSLQATFLFRLHPGES